MLGDTLTITHDAQSRVLSKINQDNFTSQYLLRTATEEFRINVRHATESAKPGAVPLERHNIEYIHTVFSTLTLPEYKQIVSATIRGSRGDDPAVIGKTAKALIGFLSDANVSKLIAWES